MKKSALTPVAILENAEITGLEFLPLSAFCLVLLVLCLKPAAQAA
jgi:hypothetical protein